MIVSRHCFLFTSAEWRALLAVASQDDARVNLAGIALAPGDGSAIATDGHRLIAGSVKPLDGAPVWDRPAILPRPVCDAAAKAAGSRGIVIVIPVGHGAREPESFSLLAIKDPTVAAMVEGEARSNQPIPTDAPAVTGAAASFSCRRCDAVFPPWRQVMHAANPRPAAGGSPVAVNARYLAEAASTLAAIVPGKTASVTIWPATGQIDPVGIAMEHEGVIWRVVLMPMRQSTSADRTDEYPPVAMPPGGAAWDRQAAHAAGFAEQVKEAAAAIDAAADAAVIPMARKSRKRAG